MIENKFHSLKESSALLNHQGMITIPFLLVSSIILFLILSFFSLAMTFAHISAVQYISYSTARKLSLGGTTDETERKGVAEQHYKDLRGKFFGNAWTDSGDWFKIDQELEIKLYPDETTSGSSSDAGTLGGMGDYNPNGETDRNMFFGANVGFASNIISLAIPFLINPSTEEQEPCCRISSFLGREPSFKECEDFLKKVIRNNEQIRRHYNPRVLKGLDINKLERVGDNGC